MITSLQRAWERFLAALWSDAGRWNAEEGFLDLGIGVTTGLLLRYLTPNHLQAPLLQSPTTGLAAGMMVTFVVTLFLSQVYQAYAAHQRAKGVVMGALFLAVNWAYLAPLYFTAVHPYLLPEATPPRSDGAMALLAVYVSLSVAALTLGGVSADRAPALYALQRILLVVFALAGMLALFSGDFRTALQILGALLIPALAAGLRWLTSRWPTFSFPRWYAILESLIFGVTLGLWQAMTVIFLAQAYAGYGWPLRASGVAWALLLGGILPLRLLANLAPPWRPINTGLGLFMSLWYLWALGHWMKGLW